MEPTSHSRSSHDPVTLNTAESAGVYRPNAAAVITGSHEVREVGRWPDFLTIEEAAHVLRIGRSAAYELAREFLATNGAAGLPVVRIGRQLRVPRARLEQLSGGPLTMPPPPATSTSRTAPSIPPTPTAARRVSRHGQSPLFSA